MTDKKIEQYLISMMYSYQEIGENLWLLDDAEHSLVDIVIMLVDPLVIVRAPVMDAPKKERLELFSKLLELNANAIDHGAYALENDKIILIDTLEYATMDLEELQATLDAISVALTQHYPILSKYRN
ncbi:YbjN domain-containing protein [Breznakiellaceae bacterium SP9]